MDAAEGDYIGVRGGGLARQAERIADEVGRVLHLGDLVVVGEDHRVPLLRERAYLVLEPRDLLRREVRRHGTRGGHRQGLHVSNLA